MDGPAAAPHARAKPAAAELPAPAPPPPARPPGSTAPGPRTPAERCAAAAPLRARPDGVIPGFARFLYRPPSPAPPPRQPVGAPAASPPRAARRPRQHRGKGGAHLSGSGPGRESTGAEMTANVGEQRRSVPRRSRRGAATNQPQTQASPKTYPSENLLSKDRGLEIYTEQKQWRIFF